MHVLKSSPQFGGKLNPPSYYENVGRIIKHMRPKSTLRAICYQLNAENYQTPSGLEWTRSRLANFLKTAAV
jgi:hypothetical protein